MTDLAAPIRDALMASADIVSRIGEWKGEPAVFTRRPLPSDAPYPCIAISPDIAVTDFDYLTSGKTRIIRDIIAYGRQPDHYRTVEEIGYLLRALCHRQKGFITAPQGYSVIDIVAAGPVPAPTDDEKTVGRLVSLTFRLGSTS
jgi:hypothetical protein